MEELQRVQAADDQRGVGSRISKALQSWQPAFNITQAPPGAAGTDAGAAAADAVQVNPRHQAAAGQPGQCVQDMTSIHDAAL
jgi:hypothetical protein